MRPDDLVTLLRSGEAARPRLVWYAPAERIELSGRVLATWASKIADLLQEEYDLGPGATVVLDGTPHWRLAAWALGAWTVGAHVLTADGATSPGLDARADVLVVDGDRADAAAGRADVVVGLTRASLARRSPVPLPAGVVDEAATVLAYADVMDPLDRADASAPALDGISYDGLVRPVEGEHRHLSGALPLADVLRAAASTWANGGCVVLTDPAWEAAAGGDPTSGPFAEALAQEGVTPRRR